MRRWIFGIAVVRQKQTRGATTENGGEGCFPETEIDVGRRSGGKNVPSVFDADSSGVSDKGDAVRVVEVADVVRSVAGCVGDLEPVVKRSGRFP